jgi:hypothetical protein
MTKPLASLIMPRTTLDLDATVLAQLRRRAAAERKSMGQLASEQLAVGLREALPPQLPPLSWRRRDMGPFKVDLEDKDAVARLLDEDELGRGGG